jgi:hypothetical protein
MRDHEPEAMHTVVAFLYTASYQPSDYRLSGEEYSRGFVSTAAIAGKHCLPDTV